jgi:bifunctional DNA-binding transcriptional regulator/antitoxin component of YhaV-PrlF toxin-antitoxin module
LALGQIGTLLDAGGTLSMLKQVMVELGANGRLTLPEEFIRRFGLDEGSVVTIQEFDGGVLVRPIDSLIETYSPERKAEFMLSNAIDAEDYAAAANEVRRMGLDPDQILPK